MLSFTKKNSFNGQNNIIINTNDQRTEPKGNETNLTLDCKFEFNDDNDDDKSNSNKQLQGN